MKPERQPAGVLYNTAFITGTNVSSRLAMLLFTVLTVRLLGAARLGDYAAAAALAAVAQTVCESGLRTVGLRLMARSPEDRGTLMVQIAGVWILAAAVTIPVALLIARLLSFDGMVVVAAGVLLVAMVPNLLWRAATMMSDSEQVFVYSAPTAFAIQAGGAGLGLGLALAGLGLYGLVIGQLIAAAVVAGFGWPVLVRRFAPGLRLRLQPRTMGRLALAAIPLGIQSCFLISNYRVDGLILLRFRGARELGLYSAAYGLVFGLTAVTAAVQSALMPALSRMDLGSGQRRRTLEAVTRYGAAGSALVALGVFLLAGPIVRFLYGDLAEPMTALAIMAWAVPFMLLSAAFWASLAAAGRHRHLAVSYGVLAVFNFAANLALIPVLGLYGAAAATVASEALIAGILYAAAWSDRRAALAGLGFLGRVAACTAAAAAVARLAPWHDRPFVSAAVSLPIALLLMIGSGCLQPAAGVSVPSAMLRGVRRLVLAEARTGRR